MLGDELLRVRDLHVTFHDRGRDIPAVRGLSFSVRRGDVLAMVGESGAGKSLSALAVLGLHPPGATVTGSIRYRDQELVGAHPTMLRRLRGRGLSLIPQDALAVLSPVHTVGAQLAGAVRSAHRISRRQAWDRAVVALDEVGIPDPDQRARAYPHEFSGGMRQRAVIAMAMINDPEVVFADEPTTALDPAVQTQVLRTLTRLRERTGAAIVLVTHDLGMVADHADQVLVMYAGRHIESGLAPLVLSEPRNPYTAGLLASLPPRSSATKRLPAIPGTPASPTTLPDGCAFAPRCPLAEGRCTTQPQLSAIDDRGHEVSCHRWQDVPAARHWLFTVPERSRDRV